MINQNQTKQRKQTTTKSKSKIQTTYRKTPQKAFNYSLHRREKGLNSGDLEHVEEGAIIFQSVSNIMNSNLKSHSVTFDLKPLIEICIRQVYK